MRKQFQIKQDQSKVNQQSMPEKFRKCISFRNSEGNASRADVSEALIVPLEPIDITSSGIIKFISHQRNTLRELNTRTQRRFPVGSPSDRLREGD